jgi:insertion element IS1 protein InsB
MKCKHCFSQDVIKKGNRKSVRQFFCKVCKKYFREKYAIRRMDTEMDKYLVRLHREGMGTRSMARIIGISHTTVMNTKLRLAAVIPEPELQHGQVYQVDELSTFIAWKKRRKPKKGQKRKKYDWWVIHAIDAKTGRHVGFVTGKRTKKNIRILISKLIESKAKKIYTDGLNIYPTLIPKSIHSVYAKCTNRIERLNLTMRTHIRRLSRKTLCFSRSRLMLEAGLTLYFGNCI